MWQNLGRLRRQGQRFAFRHYVFRTVNGMSRIYLQDLTNEKPVKVHPECREILLDGR